MGLNLVCNKKDHFKTDKSVKSYERELLTIILGFAEEYGAGPRMVRWIVLHIQLCQNAKHTCQH